MARHAGWRPHCVGELEDGERTFGAEDPEAIETYQMCTREVVWLAVEEAVETILEAIEKQELRVR